MSSVDMIPQRSERNLRKVFFGSSGLRYGWGLLAFAVALGGLEVVGGWVVGLEQRWFGSGDTAPGWLFEKSVVFALLLGITAVLGRIEGRTIADYGLPFSRAFDRTLWAGVLWALAALSLNVLVLYLVGAYSFGTLALSLVDAIKYGALWAAADVMVALAEEFALRGYLQYTLTRGIGFWPAAILTSSLFGVVHLDVPGEPWTAVASIAAAGLFLCVGLQRTGTLWFPIGAHAAFDWGLAFLYSTSPGARGHLLNASLHGPAWLTGGSAGPEANALAIILIGGSVLLLPRVYRQVRYPRGSGINAAP